MLRYLNMLSASSDSALTSAEGSTSQSGALENFASDGVYAVIGILIVFAVLALLFIILKISASVINGALNKKSTAQKSAEPIASPERAATAPPATVTAVPSSACANDSEVVAAITAAISMLLESEGKDPRGFRVVSFRRSSSKK